jgi:hypothetical protein
VNLRKRIEKLQEGVGCEVCRITPNTPIKINVSVVEIGEDGKPLPPPRKPVRRCEACGRRLPVIRLRGAAEKSSGAL